MKVKKYEKLWKKIRDLSKSITNNFDSYDEKYMNIKLNSNDDLPLKKMLELHNMVILVNFCFMRTVNTICKFFRWVFV